MARLLAGEASPRERAEFRRVADEDPEHRARAETARDAWKAADAAPTEWDVERALASVLARRRRLGPSRGLVTRGQRRPFRTALAAAAAIIVAVALWPMRGEAPSQVKRYAAAPGSRAEIHLTDGTAVVLGPGSTLTVAADFGRSTRTVTLAGDAYFEVRHDRRHPFLVDAGPAVTRVTGTKFAVTMCDDGAAVCSVRVVVREGSVVVRRAQAPADSVVLTRGLGADVGAVAPIRVAGADTATLLSWLDGRLVFSRQPFGQAVARLARWYGVTARLSDTTLAHRLVTASFAGDDAPTVAAALGLLVNARPVWSADTVVFLPLSSRSGSHR